MTGPSHSTDSVPVRGIHMPRLYDFLLFLLTRGRERAYRRDVLDLAGVAAGRHILDVGCGTGTQALAAWQRVRPGGSVTGVDVSDEMLAVARRKAKRAAADIRFHMASATALPFEDDRFDVVTMTTVMHMIAERDWSRCLNEMLRVLRPGGQTLLVDYAGEPGRRGSLAARHGMHGRFDLDRLRRPVAEAGFSEVVAGPTGWMDVHYLRAIKS
jgi:ubiquinone/menaquinone biosynthesis C-methylase UbiE